NPPASYTVTVDGGQSRTIPANGGTTTYSGLMATTHTVVLTDVPANCTASGGASKTVTVPAGGTTTAAFTISCTALTGSLSVSTSTSGGTPDPDGYTVSVTGAPSQHIDRNGTVTFADLAIGNHTVTLGGIASNCSVTGGASRTVTVATGPPVGVTFTIDCPTPPPLTGSLTVTTATTGSSQPTSYTVTVDGGSSRTIPANGGSTTYSGLSATDHTVALTDVPANCAVSGGASKTVTVTAGGTATAAFTISCTALTGTLNVTTSTSGDSPDPNGYTFTLDGGASQPIQTNQTI